MNYKDFVQSKAFRNAVVIVGMVVVALFIFQAGVFVGYHKAAFSYREGANYYEAFGEGHTMMFGNIPAGNFSEDNGTVGKIITVSLPTFIVADNGGVEKTVNITDDTLVRSGRNTVSSSKLRIGDYVAVLGSPNGNAQIQATFIRLLPAPPPGLPPATTAPQTIIKNN